LFSIRYLRSWSLRLGISLVTSQRSTSSTCSCQEDTDVICPPRHRRASSPSWSGARRLVVKPWSLAPGQNVPEREP
jgi:hypothetical protein